MRYAETDSMGVVHHSEYIVWFEVGRSSLMRNTGFSYAQVETMGYQFRIAEIGARYRAPANYDEVIAVRTWISELHSRSITFRYAVVRQATGETPEQTLVTGFTKLICTDRGGQVHRLPAPVYELLMPLLAQATPERQLA